MRELLTGKRAIVHGGGGAIGAAVARAFAREGAQVFLAGRTLPTLQAVADAIRSDGGIAHVAVVDALDEAAVHRHADDVAAQAGGIDIVLNAVGFMHDQGTPIAELDVDAYLLPITAYTRSNFLTAQAAARHMRRQGSGVVLTLSTPGARMSGTGFLGNGVSSAAVEAFSRILSGELGRDGIRVVCLRPHATPETFPTSHVGKVFKGIVARVGGSMDTLTDGMQSGTLLKRLPKLAEIADYAAFVASDRAGAMTGAIANLSCGTLVD